MWTGRARADVVDRRRVNEVAFGSINNLIPRVYLLSKVILHEVSQLRFNFAS